MFLPSQIRNSSLLKCFEILSSQDRRKMLIITWVQVVMGLLDLLGVIAIGLLGALSVNGIRSSPPGSRINGILEILKLDDNSFQFQAIALGAIAVILLVSRTLLSISFTRKILHFLSRRGALLSSSLVSRLLAQSLVTIQSSTSQQTLYSVTNGVSLITLQVLAPSIVMIADLSLLLIMATGLFLVDPTTAICTFLMFLFLSVYLYKKMHKRASELGILSAELSIKSNEKIVEVFSSYRESVVKNRRDFYAREIGKTRFELSDVAAESAFMPYISKYVIETAVVLGALFLGAIEFLMMDAEHAVATLAIFLAAGTRIAPAMLRIQQSSIQIKSSIGQAMPTLELIQSLGVSKLTVNTDDLVHTKHDGFISNIQMNNVTFAYPAQINSAISNISLEIPAGSTVAFVGHSGSGKTTMIDVLLGILAPQNGSVKISGLDPLEAISKWPGAIAYVPQDVSIISGSIRENVSLGYPLSESSVDLVNSALEVAQLTTFVESLPKGLDTEVGERGAKMSGGQRQRLGIARAMFTKPHLLVLDEATSALDGETESNISDAIYGLRGQTTVVLIAHRLSTVMAADLVIYLSDGKIVASGKFDELREMVPDFDNQAKLMGL